MKQLFVKIFFSIFFLSLSFFGYTQSLDRAKILFNEGNYEEAKPVYKNLVRQSQNNTLYNLWYGVCCYETGDYEEAEKYLLVANKRKDKDSYRYLALLYTNLYRYDEAIGMWEEYITLQSKKKEDITESETKLKQAENLLRMQKRTEDVQIIDSIVLDKSAFLNAYHLSDENGTIVMYNDFFEDRKDISSIVYTNQKGDMIYYARPSENGSYSIFSESKLLDAWGDEKILLPGNTADNNYPFVLSDGVTIYFSSKNYGSIGGYDIFVTRYNTSTNSFLTPEQMGMPFNSTANDYMMVIDESKGLGWFVSDRNQPENSVCAYLFIPDNSRKRIEEIEDATLLRNRASLNSIKDTWKEGADYTDLIKLANTSSEQNNTKKIRDFEFVINDKLTYYTLSEIKSSEAKNIYSEVINLNKQIESLKIKLNDIRESFTKGNQSVRTQLKPTILQAENQLYTLMGNAHRQEKRARNAENIQLGTKNKL